MVGTAPRGVGEDDNSNNKPVSQTYIDAPFNKSSAIVHFDDLVFRPTIAQIIDRAKLGARAH